MSLLAVIILVIILLVLLTAVFKISPFISFIIISILSGFLLNMPTQAIVHSLQKGIGDMLGSIIIVLAAGAMIGKLVADSGGAKVISDKIMSIFGEKHLQWGLLLTGLIIGIPLFYNVGFVLVIPIIFSLVYQYKLPAIYVAMPILASLSVAHSLLPPHPSPATLVGIFQADMAKTFIYGILVAIPAVILAGPIFSRTVKNIKPINSDKFFKEVPLPDKLPSFSISIFSALLPVFLLLTTFVLSFFTSKDTILAKILDFIKEPSVLMLLSLIIVSYTLGVKQGTNIKKIMEIYELGIKDISSIILIIGASGGLKQIMIDSEVSGVIASSFETLKMNSLVLGWLIAAIIRIFLGSATVAGLTTAGILAPIISSVNVDASLMVLAIGSGSIFCSHVNDTGFWMFKEYFNISIKDTFLSWSIMESIASVVGIIGILLLSLIV